MRAERRDANERDVIDALHGIGCAVWQLCAKEMADLLVMRQVRYEDYVDTQLYLLEVKDSAKPPSARKLTAKQVETHKRWPVIVVENVQQALQAVRGGV